MLFNKIGAMVALSKAEDFFGDVYGIDISEKFLRLLPSNISI